MKTVEECSIAVARAVKLCKVQVCPMYPITPSTHIPEKISEFVNNGELKAEVIDVESEHSAMSAAVGASAAGARTFTATSSQGFALMYEILPIASGMRLPIVMAVANRSLSAPISIWNDHSDTVSARDQGWIQLYVESSQEALDTLIQAYKLSEDKNILMPSMVCFDGFTLTHLFEPVDVPEQKEVDAFLPSYNPVQWLDIKNPKSFGPIGFPDSFM
ncbi:MAG: pyruvate ferredoxin oxidoreductase, partial [Candidatus Diapherotrites archaeon]|nr:pyruvate ferredoxin oxidoreductase [Candidatus Diapherotrites archaeon]